MGFFGLVALKVCGPVWANKKIHLRCDNRAVVDVLTSSRVPDLFLATCACSVCHLTATFNISIAISDPIPDLLSRQQGTTSDMVKLERLVPQPIWMHVYGSYSPELDYLDMYVVL